MYWKRYQNIGRQILILLLLYAVTRLVFLLYNYAYFNNYPSKAASFVYGIRFDLAVICWLNGILFIALLLPFNFTENKFYRAVFRALFVIINALALLLNCIDIGFFEFVQKRSTYDLFQTLLGENDGTQLLSQYLLDYWYVLLLWLAILVTLIYTAKQAVVSKIQFSAKSTVLQLLLLIFVFVPMLVLGARGGWQYRPLDMIGASQYASGKHVALVLNTPFCLLKSANKMQLSKLTYFKPQQLESIYSPIHHPNDSATFTPKNIVIIILESIGSEYTGLADKKNSLTPFLDSLAQKSISYTRVYANGKTSIKVIPAVIASIPTLFDGSFTYSAYNANDFESIASLLKRKGYHSTFFHGGKNGTMGFDVLAKAAGFDEYVGSDEYIGNPADDDGNWGIFDEPFFKFYKNRLDSEKQPFVSCIFSLSSHHPYIVPPPYKQRFKGNSLAISGSVQYADYALHQFFKAAKKSTWYKNTLFVITSDHTSMSKNPLYQTDAGIYSIPLLLFDPSLDSGYAVNRTIQQIDVMPTVLHRLHYDKPYFAFGKPALDGQPGYAVSFSGQFYQLISDRYCLQFDGEKTCAVFNMQTDSLLSKNIVHQRGINYKEEENWLKAMLQTYNQSLIDNRMKINE
jgi:phosphoglycerol transferase MdoB-like AlkP superfamily enzyme